MKISQCNCWPLVLGIQLLQNAPDEVLVMASSTLCNLLLEFSPSKEVGSTILKKKKKNVVFASSILRVFVSCVFFAANIGVGGN